MNKLEDLATKIMLALENGEQPLEEKELSSKETVLRALKQRQKQDISALEQSEYEVVDSSQRPSAPYSRKGIARGQAFSPSLLHTQGAREKIGVFHTQLSSPLNYLCMLFSEGTHIPLEFQQELGISIAYNKLSKWHKRQIALQTAAQLIGYARKEFNLTHIKEEILSNHNLCNLLEVKNFLTSICNKDTRGRGLEDMIRPINQTPEQKRRGRPSNKSSYELPNKIVYIHSLFEEDKGVHIQALWLVFRVITRILNLENPSPSVEQR